MSSITPQQGPDYAVTYFHYVTSPAALWAVHLAGFAVFLLLTIGLFTRVVSVVAFLITLAYVHRVPGAPFGLDQINVFLAMYLMVGPAGACYSVDRWCAVRAGKPVSEIPVSVSANIALRLIQLHLCILYFFAGTGKLQGVSWWEGTAIWLAFANYEYQSIDMTWLCWPLLINALTQVSVLWEISYAGRCGPAGHAPSCWPWQFHCIWASPSAWA